MLELAFTLALEMTSWCMDRERDTMKRVSVVLRLGSRVTTRPSARTRSRDEGTRERSNIGRLELARRWYLAEVALRDERGLDAAAELNDRVPPSIAPRSIRPGGGVDEAPPSLRPPRASIPPPGR